MIAIGAHQAQGMMRFINPAIGGGYVETQQPLPIPAIYRNIFRHISPDNPT